MQVSIGKKRGNQFVEGVSSGSNVITDGFFWKDVPELEAILQRNMEEYYDMRCVLCCRMSSISFLVTCICILDID